MQLTRRTVVETTLGGLTAGTLGGCLAVGESDAGGSPPAQASFFLLYDFARQLTGDELAVESVVPFGQHGHGWEPTGQVQQDIYDAPLFAYVGEGFQPWADEVASNLERDSADVVIVEGRDGIDLLPCDDEDGEHAHDQEDEHTHDVGRHDPHFWLDPTRAKTTVENLRDGCRRVDPDRAAEYSERAEALQTDLDELDETFEARLADAPRDSVVVAGHNAFRYLGDRYGFEMHALSGLSPDEELSASARRRAADVVEEHDVEFLLAPALESKRAAEQLVAETDASGYLEVAAMSGLKDEWQDADWGYVEIMREVNLPALERALGVQ